MLQDQKISKALSKFARATKEVDVTLSVAGGNRGRGDEKQKCEITVFTLRNGVVRTIPAIQMLQFAGCPDAQWGNPLLQVRAEDVEENLYAVSCRVSHAGRATACFIMHKPLPLLI